jgi:hypothetical protein
MATMTCWESSVLIKVDEIMKGEIVARSRKHFVVAVDKQQCDACVLFSCMSLRVIQQCFYGEFILPETIKPS